MLKIIWQADERQSKFNVSRMVLLAVNIASYEG